MSFEQACSRADEQAAKKKRRRLNGKFQPWLADCMTNARGEPLPNLANIMVALRSDAILKDAFAFDEMQRAPILMQRITTDEIGFNQRPVTDADVSALQERLQLAGLYNISKDAVHQAVDLRAHECAFHPVREYLASLEWDGTARLAALFPTILAQMPRLTSKRSAPCS
jgi:predicted P-loop ATPase